MKQKKKREKILIAQIIGAHQNLVSTMFSFGREILNLILIQSLFVWWRSNNVNSFTLPFKALGAFAHEAFHSRFVFSLLHRKQMECGNDISWKTNFRSFRWKHFIKLKSPFWFQIGSNKANACSKICLAKSDDHVITWVNLTEANECEAIVSDVWESAEFDIYK